MVPEKKYVEILVQLPVEGSDYLQAVVQNAGWLFSIEDEILPSYIGITISHYKDPGINQPVFHGMS